MSDTILRHNDAIDDIGALTPQHFYRVDHRVIFPEVLRQIRDKQRCDVVTVGLALPDLPEIMPYV
jgi:replicative DNA helicase